jgi:hypothetical protein
MNILLDEIDLKDHENFLVSINFVQTFLLIKLLQKHQLKGRNYMYDQKNMN